MAITIAQVDNFVTDMTTIEEFANGANSLTVTSRKGTVLKSAAKLIKDVTEQGKLDTAVIEARVAAHEVSTTAQVFSVSGGSYSFTTYDDMVAKKASIPANATANVFNDSIPSKNGAYSYNGSVFTKSAYDVVNLAKLNTVTLLDDYRAKPANILDAVLRMFDDSPEIKRNLLAGTSYTQDYYLGYDGSLNYYPTYRVSDFLVITAGLKYTISFASSFVGCFYRADKTLLAAIPAGNNTEYTFTTPANAVYVRVCVDGVNDSKQTLYEQSYKLDLPISSVVQSKLDEIAGSMAESLTNFKAKPEQVYDAVDYLLNTDISSLPREDLLLQTSFTDSYYVSAINGGLEYYPEYKATGFIEVTAGKNYTLSFADNIVGAFYDADKNYLVGVPTGLTSTGEPTTAFKIIPPTGAFFIRLGIDKVDDMNPYFYAEPKVLALPDPTQAINTAIDGLRNETLDLVAKNKPTTTNMYDIVSALFGIGVAPADDILKSTSVTTGYYVASDTGELMYYPTYNATDYIQVKPSTTYTLSFGHNIVGAFYDADKNYLVGIPTAIVDGAGQRDFKFKVPANASFMRVGIDTVNDVDPYLYENTPIIVLPGLEPDAPKLDLLEGATYTDSYFIDNTGTPQYYPEYKYTENYIAVKGGVTYQLSYANAFNGVWYNAAKTVIGFIPDGSTDTPVVANGTYDFVVTAPADAVYVRLNIDKVDDLNPYFKEYTKKPDDEIPTQPSGIISPWSGKTIAWYGTSIPAGYPKEYDQATYSYATQAVTDVGARIINKCIAGGSISTIKGSLAFILPTSSINYQKDLLNIMGTADNPDLIVFDYGVNDIMNEAPGTDSFDPLDPYDTAAGGKTKITTRDTATIIGAFNTVMDAILSKNVNQKVAFITHFSDDTGFYVDTAAYYAKMNIIIKMIAEYWACPVLEMHRKTNMRSRNGFNNIVTLMPDGIHPASGDGSAVQTLRDISRDFLLSIG